MMIDLADTTVRAVHDALTRSREAAGGPTTGVVLNLIIVTDESAHYDAVRAATQAGREHPCRVLGVIARNPGDRSRLDAEIRTGEGAPGQTVLLRLYGQTGAHADSVVMSLLAATLDQPHGSVTGGLVAAEPGNPSADLLTAWLSGRLGAPFRRDDSGG